MNIKNVTRLPNHVFLRYVKYICIVVKSVNIFIYNPSYGRVLHEEIKKRRNIKFYYIFILFYLNLFIFY